MTYLGTYSAAAVTPSFVSGTYAVSGAGSYNNINTGSSYQIAEIQFMKLNASDLVIGLQPSPITTISGSGQQATYTPGTDSYVLDVPFSWFVTGTYSMHNNITIPANVQTLTISSVPEPSTYAMALAGLAGGGFAMWRRRKRA